MNSETLKHWRVSTADNRVVLAGDEHGNALEGDLPMVCQCRTAELAVNIVKLAAEVDERREVMADVVRVLGHGCCGLSHDELAPEVKRVIGQRDALLQAHTILLHLAQSLTAWVRQAGGDCITADQIIREQKTMHAIFEKEGK